MTNVYIEHDGKIVFVKNASSECLANANIDACVDRAWFIANQISKTQSSLQDIESLSDIWINKKMLKVNYPPHIEKLLSASDQ